jgi:hypothetical protein
MLKLEANQANEWLGKRKPSQPNERERLSDKRAIADTGCHQRQGRMGGLKCRAVNGGRFAELKFNPQDSGLMRSSVWSRYQIAVWRKKWWLALDKRLTGPCRACRTCRDMNKCTERRADVRSIICTYPQRVAAQNDTPLM